MCRMMALYINSHTTGETVNPVDLMPGIDDMAEVWEEIEYQLKEERRQAQLTAEQRQKELEDAFMAAHRARMGTDDNNQEQSNDQAIR